MPDILRTVKSVIDYFPSMPLQIFLAVISVLCSFTVFDRDYLDKGLRIFVVVDPDRLLQDVG